MVWERECYRSCVLRESGVEIRRDLQVCMYELSVGVVSFVFKKRAVELGYASC